MEITSNAIPTNNSQPSNAANFEQMLVRGEGQPRPAPSFSVLQRVIDFGGFPPGHRDFLHGPYLNALPGIRGGAFASQPEAFRAALQEVRDLGFNLNRDTVQIAIDYVRERFSRLGTVGLGPVKSIASRLNSHVASIAAMVSDLSQSASKWNEIDGVSGARSDLLQRYISRLGDFTEHNLLPTPADLQAIVDDVNVAEDEFQYMINYFSASAYRWDQKNGVTRFDESVKRARQELLDQYIAKLREFSAVSPPTDADFQRIVIEVNTAADAAPESSNGNDEVTENTLPKPGPQPQPDDDDNDDHWFGVHK